MIRIIIPCLLLVTGCGLLAHQRSTRTFEVDTIGGSLLIRDIGSNNQFPNPEGHTRIDGSTSFPVEGIPVGVDLSMEGNGLLQGHDIHIRNVSGSVIIERALNDNQNIPLPETLEKLFVPGNPFGNTLIENGNAIKE
jgi:hypothetical protein